MINVILERNKASIKGRKNTNLIGVEYARINKVLKDEIKIGTTVRIRSDNARVEKHRGKYYLLYVEEMGVAHLFYQDVSGMLKIIHTGSIEGILIAVYTRIADDTDLVILNGRGKKAYRCAVYVKRKDDSIKLAPFHITYLNKSSKEKPQMYLTLYEAIMYASSSSERLKETVCVITPKDRVLLELRR